MALGFAEIDSVEEGVVSISSSSGSVLTGCLLVGNAAALLSRLS